MRKQSIRNKKKQEHHVFIISAHGALKTNLINIDTHQINYYDFAKELHTLVIPFDFSEFTNYSIKDAVYYLKNNRGVPVEKGIVKFTNIVDSKTTERYGYIFDRDLYMIPFITNDRSIQAGVLTNNNPLIFKVGVYEVKYNQEQYPTKFTELNKFPNISSECRIGLNEIAKELNDIYMLEYNRRVSKLTFRNLIYGLSKIPLVGSLVIKFFPSYINNPAFIELTQDSVIPIDKEYFTLSEIMVKLREIPKYKNGIHHIIMQACFGSLNNTEQIEQILKIEQNQLDMKVDVRESYYTHSKKIYDISSDNKSLSTDEPIYHLLEMINIEKSHITTVERHPNIFDKIKSYIPFCAPTDPKCLLTTEKISIDTIISICNIVKLWLEILQLNSTYLNIKHQTYIQSYNKKYDCSQKIDEEKIKNILEDKSFIPKIINTINFEDYIQNKLEECQEDMSLEDYLRDLIIGRIHKQFLIDKNNLDELNKLLKVFSINAVYDNNVFEIYDLMRNADTLSIHEKIKIIQICGDEKNKQIINVILDKEYVDTEAETQVQNKLEKGIISTDQRIEEYNKIKNVNIENTIKPIFNQIHINYIYDTFPKMVNDSDLDESNWMSFSESQMIEIFKKIEYDILIKQQFVLI